MQRANGSFGLWDKQSEEEFWLTPYVTDFLLRASEAGYALPDNVVDRANARLLRYLQDPAQISGGGSDNNAALQFSVQAYAGLVLARQQRAPLGALRALYEKREKARSGLALMQLGVALKLMGDGQRASLAIMQGASLTRSDKEWYGDYGSTVRDEGMMIALLAENKLQPDLQNSLLLSLSKEVNGKRWFSTQENNALYLAAHTLQRAQGGSWQAQLSGNAQPLQGDAPLNKGLGAERLL